MALICGSVCAVELPAASLGMLARLPTELLGCIFEAIDDLVDAVFFGLAHVTLWVTGWRRIEVLRIRELYPWAGDRLICLGGNLEHNVYPEGALTRDEMNEIDAVVAAKQPVSAHRANPQLVTSWYHFADATYANAPAKPPLPGRERWPHSDKVAQAQQAKAFEMMDARCEETTSGRVWAVCSLTKREYFRIGAIQALGAVPPGTPASAWLKRSHIGPGTALLSRICWSSDPTVNLAYDGELLYQGPWAGNRIEVTSLERLERPEEWKDVTEEVVEVMKEVMRAEYGDDWMDLEDDW